MSGTPVQEPCREPSSAPKSRDLYHKACDACKRRKVRCSGTNPCQHCQRYSWSCIYSSTHGRLTALERRLRASEQRVQLLESVWKQHLPQMDVREAIREFESGAGRDDLALQPVRNDSAVAGLVLPPQDKIGVEETIASDQEFDVTEDALEWDETNDTTLATDGIGSLSTNTKASGYMGPQTGNAVLRYLQSAGNFFSGADSSFHYSTSPPVIGMDDPLYPQLVSAPFQNRCMDWYFEYFHKPYPLLHEGIFRAEAAGECMSVPARGFLEPITVIGALPKPKDGSWPVLYNMVLAVGAFAGPETYRGFDGYYYNQARRAFSTELLHRGSTHLVQALSLMANYLQKRNKVNSGFTFLGIAINMAIGLGMHREFSEKSFSAFDMEIRRRIWWTIYIFDAGARLTFGRPSVLFCGTNVKFPSNLDDGDLAVDMDTLPRGRPYPTSTSSLIWQVKLAEISITANARLLERVVPLKQQMLSLDHQISSWEHSLPGYFRENNDFSWFDIPRMVLFWRSQHLRIVIFRPYLLSVLKRRQPLNLNEEGTVDRCLTAVRDCTYSINDFCSTRNEFSGALAWYATYWLVTAVFVTITCLVYDPTHSLAAEWMVQVERSRTTLERLSNVESIAARAFHLISKIMGLLPQSQDMTTLNSDEIFKTSIANIWSDSWIYDCYFGLDR